MGEYVRSIRTAVFALRSPLGDGVQHVLLVGRCIVGVLAQCAQRADVHVESLPETKCCL